MSNIIQLSKPCAFCDSRENVQIFSGLMLCGNCQDNIRITNPEPYRVCRRPLFLRECPDEKSKIHP
ncbi:hypothetical protein [Acinetobacter sp. NEB 394]|uniref:hypothetical protein n=1 Tax=Acinetobacter sp. NEB 394 TaxID=2743575 RepID=UPI001E511D44|nr:hypothetical protein [Acinetobacter sp. NEB 394]